MFSTTSNGEDTMNDENAKFGRVREFLSNSPTEFVLIYRGKLTKAGLELKWCRAVSREKRRHEEYNQLAAIYQEIAVHSFQNKQSVILKETPSRANSQSVRWCGLEIHRAPYKGPLPTNSIGQSWWDFVVEPVDNRRIGYVVIARVAAKENKEVANYIRRIYDIMRD
jgi:hypothetical protein